MHVRTANHEINAIQAHKHIYGSEIQKAMNEKWKSKNLKMNAPKDQVLRTIWNIKRTIQHRKRGSYRNVENRRKIQLRYTSIQLIRLYNIIPEINNSKI